MADNDTAVVNSNVTGSNATTPASSTQAQTSSAATSGASQAGSQSSSASVTSSSAGSNASSSSSDATTSSAASSSSAQSGSTSSATSSAASSASSAASEAPSNDNGRVLTDKDYYNSKAYQNAGFSKPPFDYDLDDAYGFPHDPNYIWVAYQLKPDETLVTMWFRYRVRPAEVMKWSFILNYNWQGKIVTMRVPRVSIPHD